MSILCLTSVFGDPFLLHLLNCEAIGQLFDNFQLKSTTVVAGLIIPVSLLLFSPCLQQTGKVRASLSKRPSTDVHMADTENLPTGLFKLLPTHLFLSFLIFSPSSFLSDPSNFISRAPLMHVVWSKVLYKGFRTGSGALAEGSTDVGQSRNDGSTAVFVLNNQEAETRGV